MMPKYKGFGAELDLMDMTILVCEVCKVIEWEGNSYIVPDRDAGTYTWNNPFDSPSLYTNAAKIDLDDTKQLQQFWTSYGHVLKPLSDKLPDPFAYPLALFKEELAQVKRCMDWIYALETADTEALERYSVEINTKTSNRNSAANIVLKKLTSHLNQHMKDISPVIDGQRISFTTDSLLAVIYYQMAEHITKQRELRRCLWCKSYFSPIRADKAVYCPPSDRNQSTEGLRLKHSPCNAAYNQQVLRTRKSVFSGKKTVEYWAQKLGRPIEEIQNWIDTYQKGDERNGEHQETF